MNNNLLLSLPNEIICNIIKFLGYFDSEDGKLHPNAYLLYATCKHFSWLVELSFGILTTSEYDIYYTTVDINGNKHGPRYIFYNNLSFGSKIGLYPSGYVFYNNNRIMGNHAYITMVGSNLGYYIINNKFYDYGETDSELYDKMLKKSYRLLFEDEFLIKEYIEEYNFFENQDIILIPSMSWINVKPLIISIKPPQSFLKLEKPKNSEKYMLL